MRSMIRLLVVACVLVIVFAAGRWAQGQGIQPPTPTVISGSDLGFRIDGRKGNTPLGTLVVRINGQWVEVGSMGGIQRLTLK